MFCGGQETCEVIVLIDLEIWDEFICQVGMRLGAC